MRENRFMIHFRLPGYNEQANEDRRNRFQGAALRKTTEQAICLEIMTQKGRGNCRKIDRPCIIEFRWIEENRKRDLDNIAFAKKYILDAMQQVGILENDSQKWIKGFRDVFDTAKPGGVIVTIEDADGDPAAGNDAEPEDEGSDV